MALQPLVLLGLIQALLSLVSQCTASMGAMVVAWGAESAWVGKAELGMSWQDRRLCGEVDGAVVWVRACHSLGDSLTPFSRCTEQSY